MKGDGRGIKLGPIRVRTVRGEAYAIDGRRLIPVARILSFGRARATVGSRRVSGQGGGLVWIQPLAVVEVTPQGERRLPVSGGSAGAMWGTVGAAVGIVLFFALVRRMVRRREGSRAGVGRGENDVREQAV